MKILTHKKKKSTPGWGACKAAMRNWPQAGLLALIQELYQLNDENRRFLQARLLPDQADLTLEKTRKQIARMLSFEQIIKHDFRHADVKRVIDQYAKASDDPQAVADLLMTDLEVGFDTFSQIGDFEQMVDHLYSTLTRLDKVLKTISNEIVVMISQRLDDLAARWRGKFGYGLSDELCNFAAIWHKNSRDRG